MAWLLAARAAAAEETMEAAYGGRVVVGAALATLPAPPARHDGAGSNNGPQSR